MQKYDFEYLGARWATTSDQQRRKSTKKAVHPSPPATRIQAIRIPIILFAAVKLKKIVQETKFVLRIKGRCVFGKNVTACLNIIKFTPLQN
ncbi:hypothetical protein P8452_57405 [Trifolium repens]|nr:hypothetical protein P8452_57405 [Trifolium repens]